MLLLAKHLPRIASGQFHVGPRYIYTARLEQRIINNNILNHRTRPDSRIELIINNHKG